MEDNSACTNQHTLNYSSLKKSRCLTGSTTNKRSNKTFQCLCCETNIFPSFWSELRKQKNFCDGILSLPSGNKIKVHRIVLSACSAYFKASFTYHKFNNDDFIIKIENLSLGDKAEITSSDSLVSDDDLKSKTDETISINIDVTDEIIELILDYAYGGSCNITWLNVEELLAASDRYEVVGLIRLCCQFLLKELSYENSIGIYAYAKHYFCTELAKCARQYILRNFTSIVKESNEMKELDAIELENLLSDELLNVHTEDIVFNAIKQWVEWEPEERLKHLHNLIPCVRFGLIGQQEFQNYLINWPLIKNNLCCRNLPLLPLTCRPRIPNQVIFVIGGWTNGSPTNSIEIYDTRADLWLNMRHTDATRAYHGICTIDQKVYILGGFDGFSHYNSMRCYDPVKYTWEEKACMYQPRCYVSVAVLDRKIYALGGYNGHTRLDSVERYDIDRNQWEMLSPMIRLRSDAAAAALGGYIYVVGGFNGNEVLKSCEMYNPITDTWSLVSHLLTPRSGVGLVSCNEFLYAIGGYSGQQRLSSVERYSVKDGRWSFMADMAMPRSNSATVVIDDNIFVIGGFNGSNTVSYVERYDPATNTWHTAKHMNYNRSAQCACVLKDLSNIKAYSLQCRNMPPNENPCFFKKTHEQRPQRNYPHRNTVANLNRLSMHEIANAFNHNFYRDNFNAQNFQENRINNTNNTDDQHHVADDIDHNGNYLQAGNLNNVIWGHRASEPYLNNVNSHRS